MLTELTTAIAKLEKERKVKGVIITSVSMIFDTFTICIYRENILGVQAKWLPESI